MAMYSSIMGFGDRATTKVTALGASTSSAEIVLGPNCIFAIIGTGNFNLAFGPASMSAAAATDFFIPSGQIVTLDTTNQWNSIRVFNNTAGNIDIYVQKLSRF